MPKPPLSLKAFGKRRQGLSADNALLLKNELAFYPDLPQNKTLTQLDNEV
jgi:hypothetical protein